MIFKTKTIFKQFVNFDVLDSKNNRLFHTLILVEASEDCEEHLGKIKLSDR